MVRKLQTHVRGNLVAYVALFFALGGSAWAVGNGPPFVTGGGYIASSESLDMRATAVDLSTETPELNKDGPAFAAIPGFGEFYLAGCWLIQGVGPEYVTSQVGYRNTTDHVVDIESVGFVQPGENNNLGGISLPNDSLLAFKAMTSGHAPQSVTHFASVKWTVQEDLATTSCRTYFQVIVQP
jgi:hypothetical protein